MKTTSYLLMLTALLFVGCGESSSPDVSAENAQIFETSNTIEAKVDGMTCGNCEAAVCAAVQEVPGVASVKADAGAGTMTVAIEADADPQQVKDAVAKAVPDRFTLGELVIVVPPSDADGPAEVDKTPVEPGEQSPAAPGDAS